MSAEKTTMTKTVETQEVPKKQRKERNRIGGTRLKLQLTGEEPGFHYAFINDENVGTAVDCGYEHVTHAIKIGDRHVDVSQMQGSHICRNVGGGMIAYLMRVPKEWYDEDMALEQRNGPDAMEAQVFVDSNSNGLVGTVRTGPGVWDEPTPDIFNKR